MALLISIGHAQKDGRRFVIEAHSDAVGEFARIQYLAEDNADTNAIATARHASLLASSAEQEARNTVDQGLQPNPRFQTEDELLVKVRARYLPSKGEETCIISKWIVDRLNDGSISVPQMRTVFGVSAAGWNAINGRMDVFAAAIDSVSAAVGE